LDAIAKGDIGKLVELTKAGVAGAVEGLTNTLSGISGGSSGTISGPQGNTNAALQALQFGSPEAIQSPGLSGNFRPDINAALIQQSQLQQLGPLAGSQFQGANRDLLNQLLMNSQGKGAPSPAELMLQAEREKILNAQMGLAASMTGRDLPAAQRQILQQQAIGQQQAALQSAILRAEEQQDAQQAYAQALQQSQSQELARQGLQTDISKANQAQALQMASANQQAQQAAGLKTADIEAANRQFGANQQMDVLKTNVATTQQDRALQAQIAQAQAQNATELEKQRMSAQAQSDAADKAMRAAIAGSVISGLSSAGAKAAAASDKNLKFDMQKVSKKDISEFFKAMKPTSYKYKNSQWGEGDRVGFIMQDIENTKLGKQISRKVIEDGKEYKGYDKDGLQGILLAALAYEAKKKGSK
jgi:hypothetical protein